MKQNKNVEYKVLPLSFRLASGFHNPAITLFFRPNFKLPNALDYKKRGPLVEQTLQLSSSSRSIYLNKI
jgi:hypothetical protein